MPVAKIWAAPNNGAAFSLSGVIVLFDSHCHLTDPKFTHDLGEVLERAWSAGVVNVVTVASDADDALAAALVAARDSRIRSTAGVHPHNAQNAAEQQDRIHDLVTADTVVAVGETGLDFHYDNSPRAVQVRSFEWHLRLAADLGKPVIVHCRSADDDMTDMIRGAGVRGVLHCFAGGPRLFDTAIEMGWHISFAGLVTFRNFDNHDLLRATPEDRLLIETDSPYLAPVPHRGHRNEPAFVAETARVVADLRGVPVDDLARMTNENARRFYALS